MGRLHSRVEKLEQSAQSKGESIAERLNRKRLERQQPGWKPSIPSLEEIESAPPGSLVRRLMERRRARGIAELERSEQET